MGISDIDRIDKILCGIDGTDKVNEMKKYIQHGQISTYDHCMSVVKCSYKINKRLKLKANEDTLLKGAMLHDFYLYDWHEDSDDHKWHGYHHAEAASRNAKKYFDVDEKTMHVIYSHMWPLNITRVPKSREAWIVCMADKYCSIVETLFKR